MENLLWGFINHQGEWVIPPQYEHAMPHMCGRAAVMKNGLYGYIDIKGEMVIPPLVKKFGLFRCNRCRIEVDGVVKCIDLQGNTVFELIYDSALVYSEGLAEAEDVNDMGSGYGYLDTDGNLVLPFQYFLADSFREGMAKIANARESFWYINRKGERIIGPFKKGTSYSEGVAVVETNRWRFINKEGDVLFTLPKGMRTIGSYSDGMCVINMSGGNDLYGFIDRNFDISIPCSYIDVWAFSDGIASVKREDKWCIIDTSGKELCQDIYDHIQFCSEGLSAAKRDGQYGFLDKAGVEVIPPTYPLAHGFYEGLAAVAIERK